MKFPIEEEENMSCCNNNCCRCCLRGPTGATGPIGPTGPTGATGATGANNLASFLNNSTGAIAVGGTIGLTDVINFDPSHISHLAGNSSVVLQPGYYLIHYNASAKSEVAGLTSLTVYSNGTAVAPSVATGTVTAGATANLTSEFVLQVLLANTSVNLQNTGANSTSYSALNFVVQRLTMPTF